MENLQITFYLNGEGIYFDLFDPIHIDALLSWVLIPKYVKLDNITKDQKPFDVPLPVEKWEINGQWGWKASALFPGEYFESIQYWRKKFRQNRVERMTGSANIQQGKYREYNTPMCLVVTDRMYGYVRGNIKEIKRIFKKIRYLGKKTAYGKGKVIKLEIKEIEEDWSINKDGKAMRWLPQKNGSRLCRCRPPYWNRIERVNCCEINDSIKLNV